MTSSEWNSLAEIGSQVSFYHAQLSAQASGRRKSGIIWIILEYSQSGAEGKNQEKNEIFHKDD